MALIDFYPGGSTEIDLRDEIHRTFFGDGVEIPKAARYILRRMRRDQEDQLIPCSCRHPETREGDRDIFCPYCFGEGALWDEEWFACMVGFTRLGARKSAEGPSGQAAGVLRPGRVYAYCEYPINPTVHDRIIIPQIDDNGQITWPIKVSRYYHIEKIDTLKADYAKVQYWRMTCRERSPYNYD